eukprot:5003995-Prorocentrum_lima.AAC.1
MCIRDRVSTASEMRSSSSKGAGEEIPESARSKRQDLSPAPGNDACSGVSAANHSPDECRLCLAVAVIR